MDMSALLGLEDFGAAAVAATDLDDLLALACQQVVTGLAVGKAKILQYQPEERELLIRAGIGWNDDVVGKARLRADLNSPAGFALQTGRPTIANDLQREDRFRVPKLLADHGVRSAVNVIMKHGDFVFGVLEADSTEPREFDDRDVKFLQGYGNVLALTVSQYEMARQNAELTRHLDVLLNELRHRTKNNNQMLMSMIRLQKKDHDMMEVRHALDDVASRINVLNAIDDLIMASGDDGQIDLGRYVLSIVNNIFALDAERAKKVKLDADTFEIMVDTRRAQAVAMVVNEFLTNSFKYAFDDGRGEVTVKLERKEQNVFLRLSDNGPGLPDNLQPNMGMRLIEAMSTTLEGQHAWRNDGGTCLELTFPLRR